MPAPFRLGLIGAGRMGRTHLRALADLESVVIAAAAESSPAARGEVAATGLPAYASLSELLDRAALDGVLITAPSDQHGQIIEQVAAAGLAILSEKPCGVSSAEARAAAQAAAAAAVPFQVAYWRRYVPPLQVLRERMSAGDLGVIHLVTCYQWDEKPPSPLFRAHSGGIAIDMGVHEFDQIRWLTGQDITGMHAIASPLTDPAVRGDTDSAQITVEMSGGTAGFISLGRYHPAGDMARAEVFGTSGTECCDFLDPAEGEQAQLAALRRQAEGFAEFARGGELTGASAADAVAALEAAEQANAAMAAMIASGTVP